MRNTSNYRFCKVNGTTYNVCIKNNVYQVYIAGKTYKASAFSTLEKMVNKLAPKKAPVIWTTPTKINYR